MAGYPQAPSIETVGRMSGAGDTNQNLQPDKAEEKSPSAAVRERGTKIQILVVKRDEGALCY